MYATVWLIEAKYCLYQKKDRIGY